MFNERHLSFLTKQPEYETVWAHGGHCDIDDLDVIAQPGRLDGDYGLDTIEMGATVGVAMEAGLAQFGDGEAAIPSWLASPSVTRFMAQSDLHLRSRNIIPGKSTTRKF